MFGCGGAGGNAVNKMINSGLAGAEPVAPADAQALTTSKAERIIQMACRSSRFGGQARGRPRRRRGGDRRDPRPSLRRIWCSSPPAWVAAQAPAPPVVAKVAREMGILTVSVVTKPFHFEVRRMRVADAGLADLPGHRHLAIILNQNLFRWRTRRPPLPTPSRWPTRCSIPASPASPTSWSKRSHQLTSPTRAVMREMGGDDGHGRGFRRSVRARRGSRNLQPVDRRCLDEGPRVCSFDHRRP